MNRLRYIVLILLLLATGRLAGQEPVIDEVCRGASYHYRVDGEVGSTYTWELTHPDGTIDQLYSTADTILIHWDYQAGTYRLEVMQFNDDFDCDAYPMDGYVIINDLPVVTFSDFGTFCIDHGPFELTGGLPEGGIYVGPGIDGNSFDPVAAGTGTHVIIYTFVDGNGCESSAEASITVAPLPEVSLAAFGMYCIDHETFELSGGLPEGGVYTGTGIANNLFDPVTAGSGTNTITYTFVDGNGCEASAVASITVAPLPEVSLTTFGSYCEDSESFELSGGLPEGGTYTGPGITNDHFDPTVAGSGIHTITYAYTDGNGCTNFAATTITVHDLPLVSLDAYDDICIDNPALELTGGLPAGGTYSGQGVAGNSLDLIVAGPGSHLITYTYSDGNGCTSFATTSITVNDLPLISLDIFDDVCIDALPFTLTGGLPAGGIYSGQGVTDGLFDPMASGSGTHTITYTYSDNNGCEASVMTSITVNPTPDVTLADLGSFCADHDAFELTGGLPEGGSYSGTGVSDNTFDPLAAGPGTHTITYTYSDANGCKASSTASLIVNPLTEVTLAEFESYCTDHGAFELTGGLPEGGTYSGAGVTGNMFDPIAAGLGEHLITYTFTNAFDCANTATAIIKVNDLPVVSLDNFDDICIDAMPFTLSGGVPEGGTYEGPGVSANMFDPMTAGLGSHEITYTYTDNNGCTAFTTATLIVIDVPEVTLSDIDEICADALPFELSGGLPEGGIYSGPGIADGIFDPLQASAGIHTYTYTYTDTSGCSGTAIATIHVYETPELSLDEMYDVCIDAESFALTGGMPEGGIYSGSGIDDGVFDPTVAGLGSHEITYTYTDSLGCTGSITAIIHVVDTPTVSLTLEGDVCNDTTPYTLAGGLPLGGTYSGDGVAGNIFDPVLAGSGEHIITYTYTDASGCTGFATAPIRVNPLTPTSLDPFSTICMDVTPFELSGGLPEGGVYSGPGITNNIFDPVAAGAGEHLITYTYTDSFACTDSDTATIYVLELPVVTLNIIEDLCIDAEPVALTGGLPEGGTYSGMGVNNGIFDAETAGVGTHLITYTYNDVNGCTAFTTTQVNVLNIPDVTLADIDDVCLDAAPFALTIGWPSGGVYTGAGVADNVFDPAVAGPGTHDITYTLASAAGCNESATTSITVFDLPEITFINPDDICLDATPFTLSGGMPAGGTYSGPGVTGNVFDPTVAGSGDHTITYTYTDANGCTGFASASIYVYDLPDVTLADMDNVCMDAETFALSGGMPTGGIYSGQGVTSGIFDPEAAGHGTHMITYTYTDANGCTASATNEIQVTDNPDVTLSDLNNICVDGTPFMLTGGWPAGGTYVGIGITDNMFDPMAAGLGTHKVTYMYTDASGCMGFDTATIRVVPLPDVTLADQGNICENETPLTLSGGLPLGGTYSGTGVTGYIFDPATAGPGNHLITYSYSDATGCEGEATATITVHPIPDVTLSDFGTVCLDMVPYILSGGLPVGGTYSGPGIDTGVFDPMAAGVGEHLITFTYTDGNSCAVAVSANITVASLPVVLCSGDFEVYEDDGTVTLSGGNPEGGVYSGTGVTNDIFDPAVAGEGEHVITYTFTDNNSCSSFCTFTITVNIPVGELIASAKVDNHVSCFEGSDAQATAFATGGIPYYTFLWSNGQVTETASELPVGEHYVVVTDTQGWQDTAYVTITQPPLLTVVASGSDVTTHGGNDGTATAAANGGTPTYTYLWGNGQTTQTAINLEAGTYFVTITDDNGCTASDSITLAEPAPELIATATVDNHISCFEGNDGQATASATGGIGPYTFLWSDEQTGETATGLTVGNYQLTVTDSQGWTATANVTITQPPLLTVIATGSDVTTHSGDDGTATATVSGGTAPYTYLWSDPLAQTTQTAKHLVAGTYMVSVTDENGCTASDSVTITEPAPDLIAAVTVDSHVSCFEGSDGQAAASATGGIPHYTFLWSNGQSAETATGLPAGVHFVVVTDTQGWQDTAYVTITQPTLLTVVVTGSDVTTHGGSNGTASATANGGTTPYAYLWSGGQTTQTALGLEAGTYTVIITDSNGCMATDSVTITQPAPVLIAIAEVDNHASCFEGSDGQATASATGGIPHYTFLWSNGQSAETATGLTAGVHFVVVTDTQGWQDTAYVTITQPTLLTVVTTGSNPTTHGGSNGSATATASGGTPPYSYLWSNGQTTATATNLSAGTYTVILTDDNGCQASDEVRLVNPLNATIEVLNHVLCAGEASGTAIVMHTGGAAPFTYLWSDGQTTRIASGLSAGSYSATISDSARNVFAASVVIEEPEPLEVVTTVTNPNMPGGTDGTASAKASGGTPPYRFLWNDGQTTATARNLAAGTYIVTVTDLYECTTTDTVILTDPILPIEVDITLIQTVSCFGGNDGTVEAIVTGGVPPYTYRWDPSAQTTARAEGLQARAYTVFVTDHRGETERHSVVMTQPDAIDFIVDGENPSIPGYSDGSASITNVTGGTPPYTYLWANPVNHSDTDATGLAAGTYWVTVTDDEGCTTSKSVTLTNPQANISISKTANRVTVDPGENITYNIIVRNLGATNAYNMVVVDELPDNVTFLSATGGGVYDPVTHSVTWSSFDILAGGPIRNFAIIVRAHNGLLGGIHIVNAALLFSPYTEDPLRYQRTVLVNDKIDMRLQKTAQEAYYSQPRQTINYEILVTNTGNVDLFDIEVTDPFATITQGSPIARLYVGSSTTVQAQYTVKQDDINAGKYENVAAATARNSNNITITKNSNMEVVYALWLPEVQIRKEAIEESYAVVGDVINYVFTIRNTGNIVLYDITVDDPGVEFDSGNIIGSLLPGETATLTGRYTVVQDDLNNGQYINIAHLTAWTPAGGEVHAISNEEIVPAVFNTIIANDDVSGLIVEGYHGGLALENVLSNDLINNQNIAASQVILSLTSDAHAGIVLDETTGEVVVQPNTPGGIYHFTYQICEALNTINCDQALVTVTVGNTSDLAIEKRASTDTVIAGEQIMYTISITNLGPDATEEVVITDIIGDDMSNPEFSLDGGNSWEAWTGTFSISDHQGVFEPGQTFELWLRGTTNSDFEGQLVNTATVSSHSFDPNLSNNTSTVVTTVVGKADLEITKSSSPNPVIAGTSITYQIQVANHGPNNAYGMVVTDVVANDHNDAEYSTDNGDTWHEWTGFYDYGGEHGTLPMGHAFELLIRGTVKAHITDYIINTATVEAQTFDPDMSNNSATVTTHVETLADLAITKTASPDPVVAGDAITYTLQITNHGPSDAHQVVVHDTIGDGMSEPLYSVDNGNSWHAWTGTYDVAHLSGTLPGNASVAILIRAIVHADVTDAISNTATVEAQTPDPDMDNNRASVTTQVEPKADLAITKTASPDPVVAGETITYTLNIHNHGPSDARGMMVTDMLINKLLDPVYSLDNGQSWEVWTGQYDYGSNNGTLAAHEGISITIRAMVKTGAIGSISNTAYVEAHTSDPDMGNNRATVITDVITIADLAITKTASPDPALAGAPIVYAITVYNYGPSDARHILLEDILDMRLSGPEYSEDQGSSWHAWESTFTNTASNGVLAAGDSLVILVRANVHVSSTGIITNTATVAAETFDPDLSNNSSSITTEVIRRADMAVTKRATPDPVVAGETITYTLEVTNHGPGRASAAILYDVIGDEHDQPEYSDDYGLTWQAWTGQYDYGSMHGDLNPGESFEILIRAGIHKHVTEDISNTAWVEAETIDPNPENNTTTILTTVETKADLEILMVDDAGGQAVLAGEALGYNIMIANHGPSDAQGVFISHQLPEGVAFVSCSEACSYDPDSRTVRWNFDSLAVGDTIVVTIQTTTLPNVPDGQLLLSTATVGSMTPDPVPENNTASVSTLVHTLADLSIEYLNVVPTYTPNAGTQIAYSIIVRNLGPSNAINAYVHTEVPENLDFVRSNHDGSLSEKSLNWALGNLDAGVELEIVLVVNIPSYVFENTVISSEVEIYSITADPDYDNNIDNTDIHIRAEADIRIEKVTEDDISTAMGGDHITYHLVVINRGPSFAYDMVITDELPAGLSFVSADDNGYYDDFYRTVTWAVPFLADGETIIRTIVARVGREVTDGTILTNNAHVMAVTHDPNLNNNQWSVDVRAEVHPELFIPEGFSPDGDGINDYFVIGGLEDYYPNNNILIIDRWGKKVHTANPYHLDWWDGTDMDNNPLPIGTYYYILELGGSAETIRGFIYLMRPY